MCSTDAVCATDRDDAKRTSRYPRAMRRARVESDNIFCRSMAELLNAMQMLRESVDGANTCWQAMISCVARSARRSSDRLDLATALQTSARFPVSLIRPNRTGPSGHGKVVGDRRSLLREQVS
jgi:hypothetical protein